MRFKALASFLDMSVTPCPRYNACAASIIVGVGEYGDRIQLIGSKFGPLFVARTRRIAIEILPVTVHVNRKESQGEADIG
ncbi:MAG: hypothetical protein IAE65_12670 [Ignavibacteria bacterium]|nr:hypothetical protein [Ignavibacteria bacterium]